MSMEVNHVLKEGGGGCGRTLISIPETPSPAPNHRRIPSFQKLRKQVSRFRSCTLCPKVAETAPPLVLTRALFTRTLRRHKRHSNTSTGRGQLKPVLPRTPPPSYLSKIRGWGVWGHQGGSWGEMHNKSKFLLVLRPNCFGTKTFSGPLCGTRETYYEPARHTAGTAIFKNPGPGGGGGGLGVRIQGLGPTTPPPSQ